MSFVGGDLHTSFPPRWQESVCQIRQSQCFGGDSDRGRSTTPGSSIAAIYLAVQRAAEQSAFRAGWPSRYLGAKLMTYLRRFLQLPANESSVGLMLRLSIVLLGLMSIALVWQAEIIANQREVIRWLEEMKIGA